MTTITERNTIVRITNLHYQVGHTLEFSGTYQFDPCRKCKARLCDLHEWCGLMQ